MGTTLCICIFILPAVSQQTPPSDLSHFKILVETDKDEIRLTCTEGCAFTELSFTASQDRPQPVDYQGMSELKGSAKATIDGVADFLFTIMRTDKGIKLVGIRGVVWEDLSFSCNKECEQWIDEFGIAEK